MVPMAMRRELTESTTKRRFGEIGKASHRVKLPGNTEGWHRTARRGALIATTERTGSPITGSNVSPMTEREERH
jgi:hypothetical protein